MSAAAAPTAIVSREQFAPTRGVRAATLDRGHVESIGSGRQLRFRVRFGPFATAFGADQVLDAALQRGFPDAKIVLE